MINYKTSKKITCYVDGSYINNKVGFGAVILDGEKELAKLSGQVEDVGQRQIAGEIMAALEAVNWCCANNYLNIEIIYDYSGIESWPTLKWRANNKYTQYYTAIMNGRENYMTISYKKVAGHSNNKYNDIADKLAKIGTLNPKIHKFNL